MLQLFLRRVFLMAAAVAVASTSYAARGGAESVWDALARGRAETEQAEAIAESQAQALAQPVQRRRALGPVPGFTLPVPQSSASATDSPFGQTKKHNGPFGSIGEWFSRLEQATDTKIKTTGHETLSFRMDNVSGNSASFQDAQYFGQGSNGIYNDTSLSLDATILKYFHYQTTVDNSPFHNPNDNRVKMDYNTQPLRVEYGDINAGFTGNSLVDFSRYVQGIKVTDVWSKSFKTSVLYSETKADARTITLTGNNTYGPYYVYAGQIVEGSDQVRINTGAPLARGTDYTLDLISGELNFKNGPGVPHPPGTSDAIAVSFESYGTTGNTGKLYGFRTDLAPTKNTTFGVTYAAQNVGKTTAQQITQDILASQISSNNIVYLTYGIDGTKPFTVTLMTAGTLLVLGIDYGWSSKVAADQIVLLRPIAAPSYIEVTYTPLNTAQVPGNRSVLGVDGMYRMGKLGSITLDTALSQLAVSGVNTEGRAAQVRLDLNPLNNLHTRMTVKDIGATFSTIESPGFNQNEKSFEFDSDYAPSRKVKLNLQWEDARRPEYTSSSATQASVVTGTDDYRTYTLGATYNFSKNGMLNVSQSDITTLFAVGGQTDNLTDMLSANYSLKQVGLNASLSRSASSDNVVASASGVSSISASSSSSTSLTEQLGLTYKPKSWLDLNTSYSRSGISSSGTSTTSGVSTAAAPTNTTATDAQIGFKMTKFKNLRLSYNYDLSDSGDTTGLNTTATTAGGGSNSGLGTFGSYSGTTGTGGSTGYGYSSYGGRSSTHHISVEYQPRRALQLGLSCNLSSSVGAYEYNSNSTGIALTANWQPSSRFTLNSSFNVQRTNYTNGSGGTNSSSIVLALQGHPFGGKLGTTLSLQSVQTNSTMVASSTLNGAPSSTTTSTASSTSSLSGRLDYPISRLYTAFTELQFSDTGGTYASVNSNFNFGMDYIITRTFKFSLGWQFISQSDSAASAGDGYKSSSLLAQLGLNFN